MDAGSKSLWASAKAKLDNEDRKLLAFDSDSDSGIRNHKSELDMLESLGQTTQEAYDICIRKRWQHAIPGKGKKIIIRNLLSKVAHWVEIFQSVGDQAVSFDPGHAALPWAGTRFLVQIAINDFNKIDFVVQGAEKIANMMARYRIVEQVYIRNHSAAAKQLEQGVVRVHGLILKYLVEAKRYFEQRG